MSHLPWTIHFISQTPGFNVVRLCTTATRLALAPDCIILTRTGEVTSEMAFAEGKEHTSFYAVPYGTLPVAVKAELVKWNLDEDGGMLALRYAITIGGQRGKCALRIRVRTEE